MKSTRLQHMHLYVVTLIITLFFTMISAHAQETETTDPIPANRTRMNDERVENIQEVRTEREGVREERRAALRSEVQDRILNLSQNITARFTSAITRLANIIGRIETRIEKLNALGIDTSVVEAKLAEAKEALRSSENALGEVGSVKDAVSSENPRESFQTIREEFIVVRESIKQTYFLLKESVALLRTVVQGEGRMDETNGLRGSTTTEETQ